MRIASLANERYLADLIDYLKAKAYKFELISHRPVYNCEEAEGIVSKRAGLFKTKSLFLKGRSEYYMVVLEESQRMNFKAVSLAVGEKKIRFADEVDLKKFKLEQGSLGPFSIIENSSRQAHHFKLVFDESIKDYQDIETHPNCNDKTIVLSIAHMIEYLGERGVSILMKGLQG